MATTAELQARLAALKKARDTGVLEVTHDNTTTKYRSLNEIDRIIRQLELEIASSGGTAGATTKVRGVRIHSGDGW